MPDVLNLHAKAHLEILCILLTNKYKRSLQKTPENSQYRLVSLVPRHRKVN